MIARVQILVAIQKNDVAPRMAGNRDGQEIPVQHGRFLAFEQLFRINTSCIAPVDDAPAAEMSVKQLVVGYIVAMAHKHQRHAAKLLQPPHETPREPRRINQHVALGPHNEIRRGAIRIG